MVYANGTFSELIAIRLDPGDDVYNAILNHCRTHHIRSGVLYALHGSLRRAEYCTVSPRPDLPTQYGYTEPLVHDDICELLSGSGTVTHEEDGTINLHIHCVFSDRTGRAFGGHLVPGNQVLLVTEVVLGVVRDMELIGIRNETGGVLFTPQCL